MNLTGCATDGTKTVSINNAPSNLDLSARTNHNSLLPASYYDSNHETDD